MQSKGKPNSQRSNESRVGKCSNHLKALVLDGAETAPGYADALTHVENCPACQASIDHQANSETNWWTEARDSWLESELPSGQNHSTTSSIIIEVQSEMPEDIRVEFESVVLSFLEPASHPELLGRLGRYEIERVIGTGGMGIVLKAHDTELHRVVAIKVLAAHLANNASARRRFAREAQAAAAVLHPNVIPIYNVESDGRLPYLVMQCVAGPSLQAKVDKSGPLALAETLRIAKQTAAGLAAAHDQGLVHRDVKPANILLEDNIDRVLLSDFGLARAVDDASLTRTGFVAGTPHYMSPEQANGDAIDTRSDQFSLGSVIYFMLSGRPPFRANGAMGVLNRICTETHRSIDQVNADIPKEVVDLIDRLLAKEAKDRFASMHFIELELERLLAILQSGGLSLSKRKSTDIAKRRKRSLIAFSFMIGMIGLLSAFALQTRFIGKSTEPERDVRALVDIRNEWQSAMNDDTQFASDLDRLEVEVNRSLQASANGRPAIGVGQEFDEKVRSIQSLIDMYQIQFPLVQYGDEK
jgi:eukaryotic-like serine/threonine-protein kinase